jgi:hypothetical protein
MVPFFGELLKHGSSQSACQSEDAVFSQESAHRGHWLSSFCATWATSAAPDRREIHYEQAGNFSGSNHDKSGAAGVKHPIVIAKPRFTILED